MSFKMDRIHVWAAEVKDQVGGVASKLSAVAESGANLEYVYTQRLPEKPGHGILFVGPIVGQEQMKAAKAAGMSEVFDPVVMHIQGDNTAGLAFRLKMEWAKAGINLHGSIMCVIGSKFVGFITFDSVEDANKAAKILAEQGLEKKK
ncbi:amino acid-binding ACT [Telmatocola sphagniphila]|uniref:Amino acid-binding ACT n=1 Tax=Telmatocola sphagniphila TaxID=1123043 RepID=A0A8E6BBA0_9BACT|nr:amino acid-binding ACT [Telmatocola sphagniphila]QVL34757.1 amino acid-binding ACT [Telmatocola sphagniphila]